MTVVDWDALHAAAVAAMRCAYAPYSSFPVGVAALVDDGRVVSGCNVENASYGLTVCAERIAIFNAVAAGETRLQRLAVVADSSEPVAPCGACRQVMAEFGVRQIFMYNTAGQCKTVELSDLLPYAFGPQQMKGADAIE